MLAKLNTWLLYILPQHALSRVMRRLTRIRTHWFKKLLIRCFVRAFDIDLDEARETDPGAYEHFDAFFTRALKPGARPQPNDPVALSSPVDGHVSQAGTIVDGRMIQAKGIDYSLATLLGGSSELAARFAGGTFVTLYLSPRDYHRIHMPTSARLTAMQYLPGRLFSVSPGSTETVRGLFTRNERLVTLFESEHGPLAMVLVGALFVSGIETSWAGMISNGRQGPVPSAWDYRDHRPTIELYRGEEMGRFHMGSTVILVFPRGCVRLDEAIQAGAPVRVGQVLAHYTAPVDRPGPSQGPVSRPGHRAGA